MRHTILFHQLFTLFIRDKNVDRAILVKSIAQARGRKQ